MNTTTPVSVLIIFYNAGKFFRDAIESVFAQTYTNWELVLADDGSSDGSTEVAKEYAQKYPDRVRYIQHPGGVNKGMSATRNLGLAHISNPYLALLDADDLWVPTKLEEQVAILDAHPRVALVFGRALIWHSWSGRLEDQNRDWTNLGNVPGNRLITDSEFVSRWLENEAFQPCTSEVMGRTEIIRKVGGWDAEFRSMYEDNILYTKIFLEYPTYYSESIWCHYRQHENNSCYTAIRQGEWAPGKPNAAKERCLLWVENYLANNDLGDESIFTHLQRALEPYRHPVRYQVRQFPIRVARRLKQVLVH